MIQQLWSTPVLQTKIQDDILPHVVNQILMDYDMLSPPNDFGKINILDNDSPFIQKFKTDIVYPTLNSFLKQTLGRTIDDWEGHRLHGWLAGYGNDYSLAYHNHRGSQISAVFYLLCEERDRGGRITFTDPRQNANRGYDQSFNGWFEELSFVPASGTAVVFPSFLYHYVSTYQSNIRLAIPVDCFLYTGT